MAADILAEDTQGRVRDLEGRVSGLQVEVGKLGVHVENLGHTIQDHTKSCSKGTEATQLQIRELREIVEARETPTEWVKSHGVAVAAVVLGGLIVFALTLDLLRGNIDSETLLDRIERIERIESVRGDGSASPDSAALDTSPLEVDEQDDQVAP